MKAHVYRLMVGLCMFSLVASVSITACGGGEDATEEAAVEPVDENLDERQAKMKEISALCGGIQKMLKEGSTTNVSDDARKLKEIMAQVATIPPPFDTEKYKFYAADFQTKADTLVLAAESGTAEDSKPAFITLTETCGVCHYTCKYPLDL